MKLENIHTTYDPKGEIAGRKPTLTDAQLKRCAVATNVKAPDGSLQKMWIIPADVMEELIRNSFTIILPYL